MVNKYKGLLISLPNNAVKNKNAVFAAKRIVKKYEGEIRELKKRSNLNRVIRIRRYRAKLNSIFDDVESYNPDYLCVLCLLLELGYSIEKNSKIAREMIAPLLELDDYFYAKYAFVQMVLDDDSQKDKLICILRILSDENHIPSICILAYFYKKGYGVDKSTVIENSLLNKANDLGSLWAERKILYRKFRKNEIKLYVYLWSIFQWRLKRVKLVLHDLNDDRLW